METLNSQKISVNSGCSAMKDPQVDTNENDNMCKFVSDQIQNNLQEPNGELIRKIVSTLGVNKSLILYQKTRLIEDNGGMTVQDGSRRKTPGGVFFNLITTDKTIPKSMVKEIFYNSTRETKRKRNEEARERRKKTNDKLKKQLIKEGLLSTLPESTRYKSQDV